ncbi:MAG: hypothetical protein J4G09_07350 [Proteobacteria bacterium]|nr:hypothetical protein [Pseudomonadota bacterium]
MERGVDKRLIERSKRRFDGEGEASDSDLPDLQDQVRAPSDEELERFREEFAAEQAIRGERIERQMAEDKSVLNLPEIPFAPIPESEL